MDTINVETKAINVKKIWFHSQQHKMVKHLSIINNR